MKGRGHKRGKRKGGLKESFEGAEEVKDVEVGDVTCDICNLTFKTTKSLRSHNEKVHAGKVHYQCSECGKGLMSKEGIEKHKLQHGDESEKLKV